MTVIRLDAAAVAQLRTATGEVILADENGNPVRRVVLPPVPDREPTEEELRAAESDPVTYSFDEVLAHLKTLERQ